MLGISAWMMYRGKQVQTFKKSAQIALVFTAVASLLTATTGHSQAQDTVKSQPMKMAAMEGLWETEQPASFSLFALDRPGEQNINEGSKTSIYAECAGT